VLPGRGTSNQEERGRLIRVLAAGMVFSNGNRMPGARLGRSAAGPGLAYAGDVRKTSQAKGGEFVIGLVIGGCIGVVLVLYAADRVLKARAQVRRLQTMSDRLAAATAAGEEQHEQRKAAARAGAALTSVLPAIQRPPLTVPGGPSHGVARPGTGGEHTGQQDHRAAHPGRPPSGNGERPARSAGRAQRR
jgi:hypothetical protein